MNTTSLSSSIRSAVAAAALIGLVAIGVALRGAAAPDQPSLGFADDFGTRNRAVAVLTWADDFGTRHSLVSALSGADDYGIRHPGAPSLGPNDDFGTRRYGR